ncbi:hypothetical protein [Horticoccus sp. 23ND18S-11]|uniref:hypothetical protein n=1 Tax=Horticoccus sp. 23ND18S-11 TaxID=3391832 RepID=UPI0039C8EAB6
MNSVQLAINHVQRPRPAGLSRVLNPTDAEIGSDWLRRGLPLRLCPAKLNPRHLIPANREVGIAILISIERDRIQHLPFAAVEQHRVPSIRGRDRVHLRHAHGDEFLPSVLVRVERLDAPNRFRQGKRVPLPACSRLRRTGQCLDSTPHAGPQHHGTQQ